MAEATSYELVVHELLGERENDPGPPAMRVALAPALSFTPAVEVCLAPGRYAWAVRAEHQAGWSEWSEPRFFEVHDPAQSPEMRRAAEAVLEDWLARRRITPADAEALRSGPLAGARAAASPSAPRSLTAPSVIVPPPCAEDLFSDVPASNPYCGFIRQVVDAGISSGCGGGKYCPQGAVTREQLAMLLARVLRAHGAREVDGGVDHTCAFLASERVGCWGDNLGGQATPPTGTFVSVSAGGYHNCGVKTDGAVACWGSVTYAQNIPPAGTFVSVSAGYLHNCGVKTDGTLGCSGLNLSGQAPPTPPAGTFVSVSAGFQHNCGVKTDGTLACWGLNDDGQAPPTAPAGTFVSVSAGGYHTCGVKTDGTLACWGLNDDGQAPPTPPAGTFVSVSRGYFHTCAVKTDGNLLCWGRDAKGQATPPGGL